MDGTMYITNKTDKLMHAIIADKYTGNNVAAYDLVPGTNKISITSLNSGVYQFELEDHNHDIFYSQKLVLTDQ